MHQASASAARKLTVLAAAAPATRLAFNRPAQSRLVAPCANEAFSPSVAGSHERAIPQSLNEDSPRHERFSQFSLLVHFEPH
jgi:hypothetical protein